MAAGAVLVGFAGEGNGSTQLALERHAAAVNGFESMQDFSDLPKNVWLGAVGDGFRNGTQSFEIGAGGGIGLKRVAGKVNHDLVIGSMRYGWTTSDLLGASRWYAGNLTLEAEFFGANQVNPNAAYLIGLTPMLRYTFATGSRWAPFAEAGFGPSYTDIGEPDLSSRFEFNIQSGIGTHYFWNDHHAITMQFRFFHLSNAGIERPNTGVNCGVIMLGTGWFF